MKIISVVGARPNFIKFAPLHRAFSRESGICSLLVHTGQHEHPSMSEVFFQQLSLPTPNYSLRVNRGTPTQQTAELLIKFEQVLAKEQPDWVLVIGDVTSTLACALAAAQQNIPVAHVEAGLRSGDRQMPEERNRILTDALSELLFVTEQAGVDNLQREGISARKIHLVGNVLIDALVQYRVQATEVNAIGRLQLLAKNYVLITLHRPGNVDTEAGLRKVLALLKTVAMVQPVVFPVHPRTRSSLLKYGLEGQLLAIPNVQILEPLGYLEFLNLMENAAIVITDSGGVQEETTFLQIPCLTFRPSTERPGTIKLGTNQLISDLSPETVKQQLVRQLREKLTTGRLPPLWDGKSADRVVSILMTTHS